MDLVDVCAPVCASVRVYMCVCARARSRGPGPGAAPWQGPVLGGEPVDKADCCACVTSASGRGSMASASLGFLICTPRHLLTELEPELLSPRTGQALVGRGHCSRRPRETSERPCPLPSPFLVFDLLSYLEPSENDPI